MLATARNHNRGRGGRGGGRNGRPTGNRQANGTSTSKKKDEKKLKKFHPLIKGKFPEDSFEDVVKELVKTLELLDLDVSMAGNQSSPVVLIKSRMQSILDLYN